MTTDTTTPLPTFDHRPGRGPALVLLHYWGGSARTWTPLLDHLGDRETVGIDTRGWGRSRALPGPFDLHRLADDTAAVIESLGLADYVVVGHSMGGKVAQVLAARHPAGLRGLVLVAPAPARPADEVTPAYQAQLATAYDSAESVAGVRDAVLTATALPGELGTQVVEDSLASGSEYARTEWPLRGIAEDVSAETARIGVPVLVVAGEHDRVEPVAVVQAHLMPFLQHGRLTVLRGSGHLVPLEAPAELARAIAAFLD
ncbi:pimeloyl-ACP methyl ester carboxylesterase [Motilibacter peucedani]|uniref:Pimeloyl-ACP methyl ester carboxylesterase n=1 Tax=Motilibacter peucedani TaxID=598650 RepID=A0A420XRM3_9ACTN|nr:alpha/beta hydrolase [Motilibacter peucedani]RKS77514.1 pimeloyl-ACP methyl ester carboxylesterase [Motilibacter peucedani]